MKPTFAEEIDVGSEVVVVAELPEVEQRRGHARLGVDGEVVRASVEPPIFFVPSSLAGDQSYHSNINNSCSSLTFPSAVANAAADTRSSSLLRRFSRTRVLRPSGPNAVRAFEQSPRIVPMAASKIPQSQLARRQSLLDSHHSSIELVKTLLVVRE